MPPWKDEQAGDADDLAAAALDHRPAEVLGEEEQARQVDVEHLVPRLVGDVDRVVAVDDAGVVDQDVDLVARRDLRAGGGDGRVVAHVEVDHLDVAAELADQLLGLGLAVGQADEHEVGTRLGEPERHALAEARGRRR